MTWIKNILLIMVLCLLILGTIQKDIGVLTIKPLHGVYSSTPEPAFSCSSWMTGNYQENYRLSLEDSVGFKPSLVRLFNQLDYTLFSIPHAKKFILGKQGCLLGTNFIEAYTGKDFIGKRYIDEKIGYLKFLQNSLWEKKGIFFMVVFAPGKGFFNAQNIPNRYLQKQFEYTNYGYYLQRCKDEGINHIDFNRWFLDIKDTSRYVLYPKTGIHWSLYGAYLCADSLRRYLEVKLNRNLPHMILDSIELRDKPDDADNDMGVTMNMIWDISQPEMAYAKFHFKYDSAQPRPSALFIGDSFYWNWYYNGFIEHTFRNKEFWYYNNEVYPEQLTSSKNVGEIDYVGTMMRQDIIVLIQTNGGYGELGYGWADLAYDYIYPGNNKIRELEQQMMANKKWMDLIAAKAKKRNVSVDHMMRLDAIHLKNQELRKHPLNKLK
jgi:hypothetical protein